MVLRWRDVVPWRHGSAISSDVDGIHSIVVPLVEPTNTYSGIQWMSNTCDLGAVNHAASQLFVGTAYELVHRIYHQCS